MLLSAFPLAYDEFILIYTSFIGAGESGKSTIFKQMKLLYGKGFDEDDLTYYADIIRSNIVTGMFILCEAVESQGLQDSIQNCDAYNFILSSMGTAELTPEVTAMIASLWAEPTIQVYPSLCLCHDLKKKRKYIVFRCFFRE